MKTKYAAQGLHGYDILHFTSTKVQQIIFQMIYLTAKLHALYYTC